MRCFVWMGVLISLGALSATAQRRGGSAPPQRGMYGGESTGRMVGVVGDPGFAGRLGATISGLPQTVPFSPPGYYGRPANSGIYRGGGGGRGRVNTVVVPYGVPIVYGGIGYAPDYSMGAPPQQGVDPQVIQQAPPVIINQYYTPEVVRPQLKEYTDLPPAITRPHEAPPQAQAEPKPPADPEAASRPTITLLAFKDSSVVSAIAYWLQGDMLHYVTSSYKKQAVPAGSLDRALSERLNAERKIEFKLE